MFEAICTRNGALAEPICMAGSLVVFACLWIAFGCRI